MARLDGPIGFTLRFTYHFVFGLEISKGSYVVKVVRCTNRRFLLGASTLLIYDMTIHAVHICQCSDLRHCCFDLMLWQDSCNVVL